MAPAVLLVYANPAVTGRPVPPYGMERIATAMRAAGCEVRCVCPFIEADPQASLRAALAREPELVGFSVRNIDDALVVRTELGPGDIDLGFYLDDVRPLVAMALERVGPRRVLLGGAALSSGCLPVLRYLGARLAIRGAAEDLVFALGQQMAGGGEPRLPDDPRVVDLDRLDEQDWLAGLAPHASPPAPRGMGMDFAAAPRQTERLPPFQALVADRDGRVPVQISTGCDRRCLFCVEGRFSGGRVALRPVDDVVAEIDHLQRLGIRRFWLGASELNVPDERHAIRLLRALRGRALDLRVFIQPAPVSDNLLDALEGVDIQAVDLSFELGHLDPALLRAGAGPCNLAQIEALAERYARRGHRQLHGSVLFGAHPEETLESLERAFAVARELDSILPDGLGLSYAAGARVYPETGLADYISAHWEACLPSLYTLPGEAPDPSFVRPVVFSRPLPPRRLLGRVRAGLSTLRGPVGTMNSEAPSTARAVEAERLIDRALFRRAGGNHREAARLLQAAVASDPENIEALFLLADHRHNHLGDRVGARLALVRAAAVLHPGDPRQDEVRVALRVLDR